MPNAIVPVPRELLLLDEMVKRLTEVQSIDTAKKMHDTIQMIEHWAKRQGYEDSIVNLATEARVRTQRRLGELLKEMPKNKGGRPPGKPV